MSKKFSLIIWVCLFFLLMSVTNAQSQSDLQLPDYWPTEGWRTDSPANRGFDEVALAEIEKYVQNEIPYLDSILIIRNGYIVYESYYNDSDKDSLHDIASVTKSWTSALVGVAQSQGKLTDLDTTLDILLPNYFAEGDYTDKSDIRLRDLLMMRSGIEYDEYILDTGGYGTPEDLLKTDVTALGLSFPMAYQPGEAWNYSSLDTQIISSIIQHAVGQPLAEFIVPSLFEPMGIDEFDWLTIMGTTVGGQSLSMTPGDMAKLGLLYLHNGVWDDQQLVPAEWVELSLTPQSDEVYYPPAEQDMIIEWYGYQWWTWKPDWNYGYRAFQARGYGGQQVLVYPELDLIIVTTANLEGIDLDIAGQQEAGIDGIIVNIIFPALTDIELDYDIHIER